MKTKTKKQTAEHLTIAVGSALQRHDIAMLAKQVESLQRQISMRQIKLHESKKRLRPLVDFGTTQVGRYRIFKGQVKGHHVKPYYCKAYVTLSVDKL